MTAERVRKCPECGRTYPIKVLYCRTDGCQLGDPGEELASAVKPTPGRDQLLGRTVARRFVLTEYIGSGATGLVYRAVHKALDREMAVKLLKRELLWDERSLLRFLPSFISTTSSVGTSTSPKLSLTVLRSMRSRSERITCFSNPE